MRGQVRHDAILDAAVELIGETGYGRISMDAIAARAQASKMTMYRKWPGKAELVAEALRRHAEGDRPDPPDTGSLRGDLLAEVEGIVQAISGPSLLGLVEAVRDDATLRELVRAQIEDRCRRDAEVICAHAVARGEAVKTALGPTALNLAVAQVLLTALLHAATPDPAALVDDILVPMLTSPTT